MTVPTTPARQSRCPRRDRRAFTLIETTMAIVILAVAMPALLWTVRQAHLARVSPTLATRARWLACERLEGVIADRHSPTRGYQHVIEDNYPPESALEGFENFSRSVSVHETGPDLVSPGEGYKLVVVSVSWEDARRRACSLSLSIVLTDYSP